MTYRKLIRLFLITVTLVLGGMWLFSIRESRAVAVKIFRYGEVVAGLEQSTLSLDLNRYRMFTGSFYAGPDPYAPEFREGFDFLGKFHIGRSYAVGGYPSVTSHGYGVQLPIWLIWILLAGGGYLSMKALERRTISGKEKNLAAAAGSGNVSFPPPDTP